ncbi:MAG: PduL/EutD family phosphate acyltransferase, partial [Myxococcota bacterium]
LGIAAPLHLSSRLEGTPGCTLEGPCGTVVLAAGLLNAMRHLHLSMEDARRLHVGETSLVTMAIGSDRARVLHDVVVHLEPEAPSALHLDPEEAAAADVGPETKAWILAPTKP